MNKFFIFVAGVLVGAAIFAVAEPVFRSPVPSAHVAAASDVVKAAERALVRDQQREALLDQREALLQADLAKVASNPPADANATDAAKMPDSSAMAKLMKTAMDQQMDMRMSAMKSRLKLTDEQEKVIRDMLDKQSQEAQDLGAKMFAGKLSKDELKAAGEKQMGISGDEDKQMQDILTPDQYTEYKSYQNDQKKSTAETQANLELSQVQGSLQLSDDQKDKVFTAIYQQYAQQVGVDGAKPADGDLDQQLDAKKAALQSVLTPEQFDTYSKFVDSQKKMINALTVQVNTDAAPAAPAQ